MSFFKGGVLSFLIFIRLIDFMHCLRKGLVMPHQPSCTVRLLIKDKTLTNRRKLTADFGEVIESKPKKLWVSNTLLTVNNQYINDFMKKLIIYIKTKCALLIHIGRFGG